MAPSRVSDLDAVTLDAFGTLLVLADPLPGIEEALAAHGASASREAVAAAFEAEGAYYRAHALSARDSESLAAFHAGCAGAFLEALGSPLDSYAFAPDYHAAFRFELADGVVEALDRLRATRLALAVVANWEITLHEWLDRLGIVAYFNAVVTAPEVGSAKPDPRIFEVALERLGVPAARALHIGDDPVDEQGARAAGMHFAPAPVPAAVEALL